ncbi:MAG: acyl-CoA dehydrogenase family protein, partial [Acidimicrobiales bacterium]
DQVGASASRDEIAMIKYYGATVLHNVIDRSIQTHGALGYSADMPLEAMYRWARAARIYDGPDEVHKQTVARHALKRYEPRDTPSEFIPDRRVAARQRYADVLEFLEADRV